MNSSPRIFILTASYGDGHLQAARTLKQSFLQEGINQVEVIDLMGEAHPFLNQITKTLYHKSTVTSQFGFDYYGWSYYMTRNMKPDLVWSRCLNLLGIKKLKEKLDLERPDAIISTFPFGAAPELGRSLRIPTFTIITDFTLHSRWLHPGVHKYYVAADELKDQMVSMGIPRQTIEVSGIPIRNAFEQLGSHPTYKNSREVLILAGSFLLKNMEEMIFALLFAFDGGLTIVCGRNTALEQKLRMKYDEHPRIRIVGYIEKIHEFMNASTCMITKAGGITLSEALALNLPSFIYKPFGGQEKENALFLSRKGLVYVSESAEQLASQIQHFFSTDTYEIEIKKRMAAFHKGFSSDFIVKDMIQDMKQSMPVG